jgi:NitT/TauT family transport system permease protein
MIFSFYQSLRTLPHNLEEAVMLYRLPVWQRFFRLEVPAAAIGLLWNAMMSFGGGWFFVAASEAISVLNKDYTLPGIGSYVTKAIEAQDMGALLAALVTIGFVIILVDQFFWRPLVAWADKFKLEHSVAAEAPRSWVLDLLRSSRILTLIKIAVAAISDGAEKGLRRYFPERTPRTGTQTEAPGRDRLYDAILWIVVIASLIWSSHFIMREVGLDEVAETLLMGMATFVRVLLLVFASTLIWVPIGVAIGFNPRLARLAQPVVQFLASFPANFLFPFATLFFIQANISLNVGSILLMALGAQWYILFNTIAGAMSIPNDLREMTANVGLRGWQLWRALIVPGIFSAWVTGAITASGGAWNASVVAEIVTWGDTTLTAYGLGSYIARATEIGDWPRIVLGVGLMGLFVVGVNRFLWRRLYHIAETKFRLG